MRVELSPNDQNRALKMGEEFPEVFFEDVVGRKYQNSCVFVVSHASQQSRIRTDYRSEANSPIDTFFVNDGKRPISESYLV